MDISQYESLINEIELLRDIDEGLEAYRKGNYTSHEEAKKQILSKSPK
jgi:predicted transcriptional regulator